jgi:L-malate glycosyltransferase
LDKIHILFVSSWYPVRSNPTHGIFNRYFAEAVSRYCRVSVLHVASENGIHNSPEIASTNEENLFTATVYYRKTSIPIPLLSHYLKYRRARKAFLTGYSHILRKQGKPVIMQLNVIMPLGPLAYNLATKEKLPYIISENWSGYTREDGNYKGFLLKFFTRRIVARAARIMPTSSWLREAMLRHGLNGHYEVVPNVVNVDAFVPGPGKSDGILRLIHISSLNDREKNVSGLIRAFRDASAGNSNMQLVIVGRGVDEDKYHQMVARDRIEDKVIFKGTLIRPELVKEINSCDALLMFSNFETFCLVIPECFACGKPVITSAAGAIPSYMKSWLGMMVPVGDEKALTAAILEFAGKKESFDPDKIREYAVTNFGYDKVGLQLKNIYAEVISS